MGGRFLAGQTVGSSRLCNSYGKCGLRALCRWFCAAGAPARGPSLFAPMWATERCGIAIDWVTEGSTTLRPWLWCGWLNVQSGHSKHAVLGAGPGLVSSSLLSSALGSLPCRVMKVGGLFGTSGSPGCWMCDDGGRWLGFAAPLRGSWVRTLVVCGPRLGGHRTSRVSYAPLGQEVLKRY